MKRGFTLVEIIICIVLIGMVSVGIVNLINQSNKKTSNTVLEADRQLLKTACQTYQQDYLKYPIKEDELILPYDASNYTADEETEKLKDASKDQTRAMQKKVQEFMKALYTVCYPASAPSIDPSASAEVESITLATMQKNTDFLQRFGWVDLNELYDKQYIETKPTDTDFILDRNTGIMFHITDTPETLATYASILQGFTTGTGSINDMNVQAFYLRTSEGTVMTTLNASINTGTALFFGGKGKTEGLDTTGKDPITGTCCLCKATVSATGVTIKDLTATLNNPSEVTKLTQQLDGIKVEYKDTSDNTCYKMIYF